MINVVSDRIRNIIKLQDQPQHQQSIKSRQNSMDSNQSNPQSKTIIHNGYHVPPRSPLKSKSYAQKSEIEDSNFNANTILDNQELIQKIKNRVMQCFQSLITDLEKKILQSNEQFKKIFQLLQIYNQKISRVQKQAEEAEKKFTKSFEDYGLHYEQLKYSHEIQLAQLKKDQDILLDKIKKPHLCQQIPPNSLASTLKNSIKSTPKGSEGPHYDPFSRIQGINSPTNFQNKCKCQKLVQQILKSQNHLMMELQYIKHFQNSSSRENGNKSHRKDR